MLTMSVTDRLAKCEDEGRELAVVELGASLDITFGLRGSYPTRMEGKGHKEDEFVSKSIFGVDIVIVIEWL